MVFSACCWGNIFTNNAVCLSTFTVMELCQNDLNSVTLNIPYISHTISLHILHTEASVTYFCPDRMPIITHLFLKGRQGDTACRKQTLSRFFCVILAFFAPVTFY